MKNTPLREELREKGGATYEVIDIIMAVTFEATKKAMLERMPKPLPNSYAEGEGDYAGGHVDGWNEYSDEMEKNITSLTLEDI